jgi:predicted GNAT superfamily acetyltransferase
MADRRSMIVSLLDLDQSALLALNNAHALETSTLDAGGLRALLGQAFYARGIGGIDALLIALDQNAAYDSPNFLWFCERYRRFAYIDRVITAPHARGQGHARRLYEDLFARAATAGHDLVVCEVNERPPNPGSTAFHARLGFEPVGRADIHGGSKTVRYLARPLGGAG